MQISQDKINEISVALERKENLAADALFKYMQENPQYVEEAMSRVKSGKSYALFFQEDADYCGSASHVEHFNNNIADFLRERIENAGINVLSVRYMEKSVVVQLERPGVLSDEPVASQSRIKDLMSKVGKIFSC